MTDSRMRGAAVSACFAAIHGMVMTDRGPALVQGLVRNEDGTVSLNLPEFLPRFGSDADILSRLRPSVAEFTASLLATQAIVHDLHLHPLNTVVQDDGGSFRLLVVDGLVTHSLFPFLYQLPGLATRRMKKKLRGFLGGLPAAVVPIKTSGNGSAFVTGKGMGPTISIAIIHLMVDGLPQLRAQ